MRSVYSLSEYENIETLLNNVEERFGYPVMVKPVNLGSSVGISVADDG